MLIVQLPLALMAVNLHRCIIPICLWIHSSRLSNGQFRNLGWFIDIGFWSLFDIQYYGMLRVLHMNHAMIFVFRAILGVTGTHEALQTNVQTCFIFGSCEAPSALIFVYKSAVEALCYVIGIPARANATFNHLNY